MTRLLLLFATLLAGIPAVLAFTIPAPGLATERTGDLTLIVSPPDRQPYEAHFLIRAGDSGEAMEAALLAALELSPGATVMPAEAARTPGPGADAEGRVTAQWAPWGWRWDAAELPLRVLYNPSGAPDGFTPSGVTAALDVWSRAPGSSFAFAYAGETDDTASMATRGEDGINVISWENLECDPGCVLGVTTKSFTSHEADIVLNSNPRANLGDGTNGTHVTSRVLLHEAGHLLGLEHSCPFLGPCSADERKAVMFYAYGGDELALGADDLAGLRTLYPATDARPAQTGGAILEPVPAPSLEVVAGWNLVAVPGGSVDAMLEGLTCVDAAYRLDADGWAAWIRGLPGALQTLGIVQPGEALWLHASGSC